MLTTNLSDRQNRIINLLISANQTLGGEFLARKLNVSSRTIRSEIKNINILMKKDIIVSSPTGYTFNYDHLKDIEFEHDHNKSQNFELLEILLKNQNGVDLFDLAEELYVSYSTIIRYLDKLKPLFERFDLCLIKTKNTIAINGCEHAKRELISYLIYQDLDPIFLKTKNYLPFFAKVDLRYAKQVITDSIIAADYHIEEIYAMNLVINISIAIDRILSGYTDSEFNLTNEYLRQLTTYQIAQHICAKFEEHYDFHMQQSETDYIAYLVMGQVKPKISNNIGIAGLKCIDDETRSSIYSLVQDIFAYYLLDIDIDEFFSSFIVHVDSLITRNRAGNHVVNVCVDTLKSSCPFIYEVAIEIARKLNNILTLHICDDEIGFIAIHIGYAIEQSTHHGKKIKTLILNNDYHQSSMKLVQRLKTKYADLLDIKCVSYVDVDGIIDCNFDLIISTIKNNIVPQTLFVSPLLNDTDMSIIDERIEKIQEYRFNNEVRRMIMKYFRKRFFFLNEPIRNEREAIDFMCRELTAGKIVDSDFEKRVYEREKMSSTCINQQFAIPHAINIPGRPSAISLLINKEPIDWSGENVHLVILLAFSENDLKEFMDAYNVLCKFLCSEENLEKILKVTDYEELIKILNRYI